ncbi:MAG: PDZ domain-containing protein [Clostridia bacterium]|nr:PDZ domain-containing protein [Clostridia bacterium]
MDFKENNIENSEYEAQEREAEVKESQQETNAPKKENQGSPVSNEIVGTVFDKKYYIALTSLLVALGMLLTFVITYVIMTVQHQEEVKLVEDRYDAQLDYIGEFRSIIDLYNSLPEEQRNIETYQKLAYIDYYYRTNYVGKIDNEQLEYMVLNGYIMGIGDRYGGYYTSDEFKTILGDVEGNTVGIGVYISADKDTDGIRISYVMKDGPANKGGLLPGDIITHVDGQPVSELGYYVAIDAIKGTPGTEIKLIFNRDGTYIEKTLVRASFDIETVIYSKHETEKDTGIIRIVEFNNATSQQFIDAVKYAVEVDGCTSLVFDLRGNPGGTMDSVVAMLDFMLPECVLVTQRFGGGQKIEIPSDLEGEEFTKLYEEKEIKMAVLVNGDTASAAELFTSAMKDIGDVIIVGEKTFGKGCGQNVIPLSDGTGFVFTTFMYDPPISPNYDGVGISPDIEAKLSDDASNKNIFELSHAEDDQLKAAVEALNK